MWDWETGIAFGQALERLKRTERLSASLRQRVEAVERRIGAMERWPRRAALLALLWGAALGVNLTAEEKAAVAAAIIKQLID
jgi:hypothetical protein